MQQGLYVIFGTLTQDLYKVTDKKTLLHSIAKVKIYTPSFDN